MISSVEDLGALQRPLYGSGRGDSTVRPTFTYMRDIEKFAVGGSDSCFAGEFSVALLCMYIYVCKY